jgi:cytochrome P450
LRVSTTGHAARGLVYDPFSLATQLDPYPAYAMMLTSAPVYRNEERDFFALSRFDDVYSGFRDWRRLSSAGGVTVDELLELTGPSILTMDPPRHDELRAIVRPAFEPKALSRLEARLVELATELLDGISGGEFDFCAAFSKRLPVLAVCELMGFPHGDERMLKAWSDALIERVPDDVGTPPAARRAAAAMRAYFAGHLQERRLRPSDDILSLLVASRPAGSPLGEDELIGMCFLLFEAGNSTTAALLANALVLLEAHPDQRAALCADAGLLAGAVEEVLRFESPVQNMGRVATEPIVLHGTQIPAGARVLLVIGAAHRDPRVWPQPDRFDVTRAAGRRVAFGGGLHACLGAGLARLEARVALGCLLERHPHYGVLELERFHDVTQRGLKRLIVAP